MRRTYTIQLTVKVGQIAITWRVTVRV